MKSTKIMALVITGLLTLLVSSSVYGVATQDQVSSSSQATSNAITIPYQGNLTDEDGNPVADGKYAFLFSIYEDQNQDESVWSEVQEQVILENGVFAVQLGSIQPLPAVLIQSDHLLLRLAVRAQGEDTFAVLNPPQVLQPVSASNPESISAQAACAHDHLGETWTNDSYPEGIIVESNYGTAIHGNSLGGGYDSIGLLGTSNDGYGVKGESNGTAGVRGYSEDGMGVEGVSDNYYGVSGVSGVSSGLHGSSGTGYGVNGVSTDSHGVYGFTFGNWSYHSGVYGEASQDHANGVTGWNTAAGPGVYGFSDSGYAGYFAGDVEITGDLNPAGGGFKIDHPLDPENQYLHHSFVESPDMKNVYDGVVVLDVSGESWVAMPDWFETLNVDYRYQLTAIGAPAPGLYIAHEIEGNRFQIAGGSPGLKVSWQVTGIRQDPYAETHRIPVAEDKTMEEQGRYLHPVELGLPAELGLNSPQNQ